MSNNTDYNKPHTEVYDLLPNVFRSDVNKAVSENVFDRFLSKKELVNVVGTTTSDPDDPLRLPELDIHRQNHQLQPLLYTKIATVDHISSFKDLIRELIRLGVNYDRLDEWLSTDQFNFTPPIDLDKIVNFFNYYWLDSSEPQYITIKHRFLQLSTIIDQAYSDNESLESLVQQYELETDSVVKDSLVDQINLIYLDFILMFNEFRYIQRSKVVKLAYDPNWDDLQSGVSIVSINFINNSFYVTGDFSDIINSLQFTIPNLYSTVSITGGINAGTYTMVGLASYNPSSDRTEIRVIETIPDSNDINCVIDSGDYDNPVDGFVITAVTINTLSMIGEYVHLFDSVIDFDVISGPNIGTYTPLSSVYDIVTNTTTVTINETLPDPVSNSGVIYVGGFNYLLNNNLLVSNPFDFDIQTDQWSQTNKWMHISDVPSDINLSMIHRGEQPIIEYEPHIEMNQWSCVDYVWDYSSNGSTSYQQAVTQPSSDEILISTVTNDLLLVLSTTSFEISVSDINLKLTPNAEITIEYDDSVYSYHTIESIVYDLINNKATVVVDSVINDTFVIANIQPIRQTSLGDDWRGFANHWIYKKSGVPLPCNDQIESLVFNQNSPLYDSTRLQEFFLIGTSWFFLNQITILDIDDVRVYVNGQRIYGTYSLGYYDGSVFNFNGPIKNSIWFFEPPTFSIVRVEVGPIALSDETLRNISVRTSPDDENLTNVSLVRFKKNEQIKYEVNQYPLFNMFNLDGSSALKATSLWSFLESSDYNVSDRLGKRIVVDVDENYTFDQHLLESDNERIYAYKQKNKITTTWRTDSDNIKYTPKYIDTNYQQIAVGDSLGDWELPKQMTCNLEHENRKHLTTIELFQHFNSIIENQQNPPGFSGSLQNRWRLLDTPKYGAGGTIKEFSDGFDTFLSSLYVNDVNTIQLIDFAKREYENSIRRIRTFLTDNLIELLVSVDVFSLHDIQQYLNDQLIQLYQEDDFLQNVYGDSTSYDQQTGMGIKNWITTLPRLGLMQPVIPQLLLEDRLDFNELTHHDGHKSHPRLQNVTIDSLTKQLKTHPDTIVGQIVDRPTVSSTSVGLIYYATDVNQFFKCVVSVYSNVEPSSLVEGSMWFDTNINVLKRNVSNAYIVVPDDDCWQQLNFQNIYGFLLLDIERRLHQVSSQQVSVYDITQVQTDVDYSNNLIKQFGQYVAEHQIADPMASIHVVTNPFTWNFSFVDINDYRVNQIPSSWNVTPPSTWYNIYNDIFGTRNPQLEPWVLQSYDQKPTWWDQSYNIDVNRRWSTQMWLNIMTAQVPEGQAYPSGVISNGVVGDVTYVANEGTLVGGLSEYQTIPVNITNDQTQDGLYKSDDLLPPYYNSINPLDVDVITYSVLLSSLPNQSQTAEPFTFGQNGFTEDVWRTSIEFPYVDTKISYITDPMRFVFLTQGSRIEPVNGLQVDIQHNNITSHRDVLFHGDMVNDVPIVKNGINQWYVNFFRYKSSDINTIDFRDLWKLWRPVLSYQLSSFVDGRSVALRNDTSPFDEADYNLRIKKTPGFRDYYIESLYVVVNEMGTSRLDNGVYVPTGLGQDWRFRCNTANPKHIPIKIYGIDHLSVPTTFNVLNSDDTSWNHFSIDRNIVMEYIPGTIVDQLGTNYQGVQGVVNLIDGYVAYLQDSGFVFNDADYSSIDPTLSRLIDWQLQIELMINQIYRGMVTDKLPIQFIGKWSHVLPDVTNNLFTATQSTDFTFIDNDHVQLHSNKSLPLPFVDQQIYQIVNVNSINRTFQLMDLDTNVVVDVDSIGSGTLTIGMHRTNNNTPQSFFELNPFKHNVVFDNELGIISNIHDGSFQDITSEQGIYDQYGRPISTTDVRIYRGDKRSFLKMFDNVPDDIRVGNTLHIGGMHLFLDGYEHTIMFNSQSINGALLFDEFLGLQITKVTLNIRTNYKSTFRPNIGGRFLLGDNQIPNIEAVVGELQNMYDVNVADEDSELVKAGRELLGFQTRDYFDDMGITPKSQFLFYRGMIQQKGTFNAIKAFINLRAFIDANVDDYWAYKINDFGDANERAYPRLNLYSTDTHSNTLLLQFVTQSDNNQLRDHQRITLQNSTRWNNLPEQMREIFNNKPNLFFESEVSQIHTLTGLQVFNQEHISLPVKCDGVTVVVEQSKNAYRFVATSSGTLSVTLSDNVIPFTSSLKVTCSRNNGTFSIIPSEYIIETTGVDVDILNFVTSVGDIIAIESGDVFEITTIDATLVEDIHYQRINSKLVYFDNTNILQNVVNYTNVMFFCHNIAKSKLNPFKLLDVESETNLQNIIIWDPAKDHHYHNAEHIVDFNNQDPAYYTDSLIDSDVNRNLAWLDSNIGNVWKDDSQISYKPYHDDKIFPLLDRRLELWGQLEDWSELKLYEWVKSSVHPNEYVEFISDNDKLTGVPKRTLFKRNRNGTTSLFDLPWVEITDFIIKDILTDVDGTVFNVDVDVVNDGDVCYVYQNGQLLDTTVVSLGSVDISSIVLNSINFITIVVPQYVPTDEDLNFDPNIKDDLSLNVQYVFDYKYVKQDRIANNTIDTSSDYYFWVRHTATNHSGISLEIAEQQLVKTPSSYVVFNNLLLPQEYDFNEGIHLLPSRYSRCALRGLVNTVTSDDRFILQFTRDFTLRDTFDTNEVSVNLKNKHSQWKMFRERQRSNIDRYLWNKVIEACSGRTILDSNIPVPSLDYVLYDVQHDTNYQYGLNPGQSFIDSAKAISIIIEEINNPDYDLFPIDRDQFLAQYSFDSPENTEITLNAIYNNFLPEHVNRIWFAVLFEALSANTKFVGLFKTSWIQLDGVRLLDTSGVLQ